MHLAEVKGPVMDRLKESDLLGKLNGQVFLSAAIAWDQLAGSRAAGTPAAATQPAGKP